MSKPVMTHDGDHWTFVWPDPGIAITLNRVRESSSGVTAECLIEGKLDQFQEKYGHITRRNLNLLAPSTRKTFSTQLSARTAGRITEQQWESWLETASENTVRQLRQGEPFLDLAEVEPQLDPLYLVDYLLPEGEITIVAADGEIGKGWLAVTVAVSVLEGRAWVPGIKPMRKGGVLYLDWETGHQEIRRRQAWVENGLGITRPTHLIYRHMSRGACDDLDILRNQVREEKVELVIVDSLGPATADELEQSQAAIRVMSALRELPCTKLVLAHVSKAVAQQSNGRGRTLGSVQFENQARSVWEMRHEDGSAEIALFHRKANVGPHRPAIVYRQVWNDQTHTYQAIGAEISETADLQQYLPPRQRAQEALRRGALDLNVLAERIGVNPQTLKVQLHRWKEFVVITGGGGRGQSSVWGLRDSPAREEG